MTEDRKPSNLWTVEGYLGKKDYIKRGTTKAGKPYMIHSIAVWAGKDKETGKNKYDNISWFVPADDHSTFDRLPDKQKVILRGKPIASAYTDKEGNLVTKLQMQVAWENYYELVGDYNLEVATSNAEYSDEPF
jgi:hypothetical protein